MTGWTDKSLRRVGVVVLVSAFALNGASLYGESQSAVTSNSMLADQLVTRASQGLRGTTELRDDQLETARILLELALEIFPKDLDAWRLRVDVARAAEDLEGQSAALDRYMMLAPDDDVAQLDAIRLKIQQEQSLDARVAKVARLIDGPQADQLSAALRSRLASYCAQAALEMGDSKAFKKRVTEALSLDQTNDEAARMMYEQIVNRRRHPNPRFEGAALMWWLKANPLSMEPRRKLAELLLGEAAYEAASKQFHVAQVSAAEVLTDGFYYDWALCRAAIGDAANTDIALSILDAYEHRLIATKRQEVAAGDEPNVPEDEAKALLDDAEPPVPDLPLDLELLRLAILHHSGRKMLAQGSYGRIQNALTLKHADDKRAGVDLAWLAAWLGPGVASEKLDQLAVESGQDEVVARIRGWMALRDRNYVEARRIFEQLVGRDPFARYGLARCDLEDPNQPPGRERLEYEIVHRWPSSLTAMLAARDLASDEITVDPLPAGRWIIDKLDEWPVDLREPDPRRTPWTILNLEFEPKRFAPFQPILAKVILRNNSDVPLAFKPKGTIPSRLFLYVSPAQQGMILGTLPPIVVNVGRRLRIEPHESIELYSRIDRSDFGIGLVKRPGNIVGFNVTGILDPYPMSDGTVEVGLLGDKASEFDLRHIGAPFHIEIFEAWLKKLDEPNPTQRMVAIANLEGGTAKLFQQADYNSSVLEKARKAEEEELDALDAGEETEGIILLSPAQKDELKDQSARVMQLNEWIGKAVIERFGQMSRVEQAWTICFIPRTARSTELFGPVLDFARNSKDPLVRITYLAFHVSGPDAEAIADAKGEADPNISGFAKALQQRFESRSPGAKDQS